AAVAQRLRVQPFDRHDFARGHLSDAVWHVRALHGRIRGGMMAPETGLANPVLVGPIWRLAEMRCPRQYAVAEVDLKRLRLDPPRLRLWLNEQEIRFGDTDPTDAGRYVQVGATVFLCADSVYPLLTSAAGSFIAPSIESLAPTHPSDE
ncbi:MAG: hypothetical protein R6X17_11240, partial [Candidatus Competibacteraceae bacterium]